MTPVTKSLGHAHFSSILVNEPLLQRGCICRKCPAAGTTAESFDTNHFVAELKDCEWLSIRWCWVGMGMHSPGGSSEAVHHCYANLGQLHTYRFLRTVL